VAKLDSLLAVNYPRDLLEVSDGLTDRTEEIARSYRRLGNIRLFQSKGGGKALALGLGLAEARGETLFLTDVRQILEPDALRNLVAGFADPSVGATNVELIIREGDSLESSVWDFTGNRRSGSESGKGGSISCPGRLAAFTPFVGNY
jgi:cellulose synthase/poly-beta-1,6-N-acetylglucosamine synthase-like glycosyltransferase